MFDLDLGLISTKCLCNRAITDNVMLVVLRMEVFSTQIKFLLYTRYINVDVTHPYFVDDISFRYLF